jgi:DNA primase
MNISQILQDFDVKILTEDLINYNCQCPWHQDSHPSFSMNKNTGAWICRAGCGSGYLDGFFQKIISGGSSEKAKEYLEFYGGSNYQILQNIRRKIKEYDDPESKRKQNIDYIDLPPEYIPLDYSDTKRVAPFMNYLMTRDIHKVIAHHFNIGACITGRYANRIIIPITLDNNHWYGFISRSIDPNESVRYLNSNTRFSKLLFGLPEIIEGIDSKRGIYLCESTFDALTIWTWRYTHESCEMPSALATFGARISYEQIDLLLMKGIKKLYICFHNDEAGRRGVLDKINILKNVFDVHIIRLPQDKDINEMYRDEFLKCVEESLRIQPEVQQRVQKILQCKLAKN